MTRDISEIFINILLQYYTQKTSKKQTRLNQEEEGLIESPDEESSIIRAQNSCKDDQNHPKVNGHTIMDANEASNTASDHNPLINMEDSEIAQTPTSNLFIIRKIWVWIVSVFITFVICLSVFPSITAIVESTGKGKVSNPIFFDNGYLKSRT